MFYVESEPLDGKLLILSFIVTLLL